MVTNVVIAIVATGMAVLYSAGWIPIQAQSTRSIWSGVYTESQAHRGEELYGQSCARCHAADLTGMPVTPRFPGARDRIPELVGPTFVANYEEMSLCDLVERIRISMPQDRPGSLNRRQVVDVVAYLLFQGGFPFGRTELTTRLDDLQEIRIRSHRSSASVIGHPCHARVWK